MNSKIRAIFLTAILMAFPAQSLRAADGIEYGASLRGNAGSGDFAPHLMMSNRGGTLSQTNGLRLDIHANKKLDLGRRFDYGFGAGASVELTSATDYMRYDPADALWYAHGLRPAPAMLDALWAEVKFRGLFLTAGMKENDRSLFDSPLSSGDITMSRNARAIPQVRIGFIDFQNVPFTNGWLQIQGELAYGRFADNNWLKKHYNRYSGFITTNVWMHYARAYFRSNPSKPFSVTIGMQHAAQFGGDYTSYLHGNIIHSRKDKVRFKTFFDVLIPRRDGSGSNYGDQAYYNGNHLGSWDFIASYRFHDGSSLSFSWQSPWEDGSGIGKLNGWDGVYALEYRFKEGCPIKAARFEYLDFRNQSGPIHWAPGDHPGSSINGEATGNDNYYNNFNYNGWANYGMSVGTPFLPGPIFNTDGLLEFADNLIYGFHAGVEANPLPGLDCRMLFSWRKSAGTNSRPHTSHKEATSMLLGADYSIKNVKGLSAGLEMAFDAGKLTGNRFGVCATVSYTGFLDFKSGNNTKK